MKPNVLLMTSSFHQGGSERQAVQLARTLHESGAYNVRLGCLRDEGVLRGEAERLGLGEIPAFPLSKFYDLNALKQQRRCISWLKKNQIHVVQSFDFYTNVFSMTAAALARVPARIAARRETDGVRTSAQKFVERRAFDLAHVVAANSEAVRQELIRDGVAPDKVVTIYNGMDTERIAPQIANDREASLALFDLAGQSHRRFVTIVANMRHAMKDQATFLRAAQHVRSEVPEAAFILAGEGELVEGLRQLASSLGLAADAFFIGRCVRVAELLAISEVCVLSSKGVEGFSNSITEYMAAARPVVATDVGGAREAVVDGVTGYIVRPEDEQMMAERIISLLREPERARAMGERGRQLVREKFSCEAQLENTRKMYDRLLASSSFPLDRPASALNF